MIKHFSSPFSDHFDRSQIPSPGTPRPFNFPAFERFRLPNGLEIVVASQNQLPLLSINLCIKSSTLFDPRGKEGLANLVAETLFEGTGDLSSTAISNQLELLGAQYCAYADWNALHVELNVLKKNLKKALPVFSEVALHPAFPGHEFERIKKELIIERGRTADNPSKLSNELLIRKIYGNLRYGSPLEGRSESIQNIEIHDLHEFYEKHFRPDNAALIFVGDIKTEEAKDISLSYFQSWTNQKKFRSRSRQKNPLLNKGINLIHKSESAQSELRMGHLGIERNNDDYYAVTLLNEILGGYFLSRLNMNLREKHGYTYGASTVFSCRKFKGPFMIASSIQNEFIAEAIIEITKELERIRSEEVSEEEISHAKGYLCGVFPAAFETMDQIALGLANIVVFDLANDYYRTFRDKISAVSRADILLAGQKYIHPDQLQMVVCADRKIIDGSLRRFGKIQIFDVEGKRIS